MKLQLLYQKVYFKADEWKELLLFIHSILPEVEVSLLSKNTVDLSLKEIKTFLIGECVIFNLVFDSTILIKLFTLVNKIQQKYASRIFLVGFLLFSEDRLYFFKIDQLKNYFALFTDRKKNVRNSLISLNQFLLYEFLKFLKLTEVSYNISMLYFKNKASVANAQVTYFY